MNHYHYLPHHFELVKMNKNRKFDVQQETAHTNHTIIKLYQLAILYGVGSICIGLIYVEAVLSIIY